MGKKKENKMEEEKESRKKHVILVHGACHGGWSWYKVAPLLESRGFRVTIPDLAACGIDMRRIEEVGTFAEYSQPLLDAVSSLPPKEKAVLVGHSFGGMSIALAAELFPEKVEKLVFAAAFMPNCSAGPVDPLMLLSNSPPYDWIDTQFNPVKTSTGVSHTTMLFGPKFISSKLYQLCSRQDLMLAAKLARTGSLYIEDLTNTPPFTREKYGSVPRYYIMCPQDLGIPEEIQKWMIEKFDVNETLRIEEADHMLMLSAPQELCKSLCYIADK